MATKHSEKSNVPVDASAGWEKRDVNIKALFKFAFWMAVVLAVTMVGMNFAFKCVTRRRSPLGPTMSPMVQARRAHDSVRSAAAGASAPGAGGLIAPRSRRT